MDLFTGEKRSWIMGRIRSKNTKPEIIVRSLLHRMGFRFSLRNRRMLPASPDIVLPKYRTIILVHGCFWHRHKGCRMATSPKSRRKFWDDKFEKNVRRDRKNLRELRRLQWNVITVWECEVLQNPAKLAQKLHRELTRRKNAGKCGGHSTSPASAKYSIPKRSELIKIAEKRADYAKLLKSC